MKTSPVLGVVGASGGVGASSLVSALAVQAAALDLRCLAVDAVACSGGLDISLALDEEPGLRWPDVADAVGAVDAVALWDDLPKAAGLVALSQDRSRPREIDPAAVCEIVRAMAAAGCALILIDLPRVGSLGWREIGGLCDDIVLVGGHGVAALASLAAAARRWSAVHSEVYLVQRVTRGDSDLAESVALATDLPLLAEIGDDARAAGAPLRGIPVGSGRGPLASAAAAVLDTLRPAGVWAA